MSYRKDIEEGRYKVVTGDDRPVNIIKWDQSSHYPIVATVSVEMCEYEEENCITQEMSYNYDEKGRKYGVGDNNEMNLFVLTDEPELSKGEAYLLSLLEWAYEMGDRGDYRPDFEGCLGSAFKTLIACAKDEWEKEKHEEWMNLKGETIKAIDEAKSEGYSKGVEDGKAVNKEEEKEKLFKYFKQGARWIVHNGEGRWLDDVKATFEYYYNTPITEW